MAGHKSDYKETGALDVGRNLVEKYLALLHHSDTRVSHLSKGAELLDFVAAAADSQDEAVQVGIGEV